MTGGLATESAGTGSDRYNRPVRWLALIIGCVLAVVACATESPPTSAPEVVDESSDDSVARGALPSPPLAGLEPALAEALTESRSRVDDLLADPAAPAGQQARAVGELGRLYQAHRLLDVALECYRAAHALQPDSFDWAYHRGVLAASGGSLDEASNAFRAALAATSPL